VFTTQSQNNGQSIPKSITVKFHQKWWIWTCLNSLESVLAQFNMELLQTLEKHKTAFSDIAFRFLIISASLFACSFWKREKKKKSAVNSVAGKSACFKEVQITFILKIGHTLNVIMSNKCDYHTLINGQKNRGEPRQLLLAKARPARKYFPKAPNLKTYLDRIPDYQIFLAKKQGSITKKIYSV